MSFLSNYVRPYWKLLVLVLVLAAVNQIFSLMGPQVLSRLIDNYLLKAAELANDLPYYIKWVLLWLGGFIGAAMVSRIAKAFQDYFVNVMTQKIGTNIYQNTIAHTFSLPYAAFEDQQSGNLLSKLVKAKDSIQLYIANLINIVFFSLIGVIFVLGYALRIDRRIAVLYAALIPLLAIGSITLSKRIKKAQLGISK